VSTLCGGDRLRRSKCNAPVWHYCSTTSLRYRASRLLDGSDSLNKPYGNGEGVGVRRHLAWMINLGPVVRPFFPPEQVALVKTIACELPAKRGLPLSRFSLAEIVRAVLDEDCITSIGRTTVWRILHEDSLRPWYHKTWIFPRDPQFREKAAPVLDLYQRRWKNQPLGPREFVLSTDEKTSIQARRRIHSTQPTRSGRPMRVEHEYVRGGALAYLAAWDVASGRVSGRCEPSTGIKPFERLVDQVMTREPYRSADRVFWIADNGSSHRGDRARQRLSTTFHNARLVSLPVHASWLNQVEIWFSIVQRKALTPNDLESTDAVEERLMGFQEHHNVDPKPFHWKFTKRDLNRWLNKLN
jgi:hypothetical protein